MVIGECSKSQDMYVNPCVKKQLTNIRAAGADEKIVIHGAKTMSMQYTSGCNDTTHHQDSIRDSCVSVRPHAGHTSSRTGSMAMWALE